MNLEAKKTYGWLVGRSLLTMFEMPEKISLKVHCSLMFSVVAMAVSMKSVRRLSMNSEK